MINFDTKEVIVKGDYYHAKIIDYIDGFLHGLRYVGIKYEEIEHIEAFPGMEEFNLCNFENHDYNDDE